MATTELIEYENAALADIQAQEKAFELAQRKAQVYAKSTLVPKEYQNNIGNVLIAANMAERLDADLLMVMQNLYVVNGRPGWSAQFLIATFNSCGAFSPLRYEFTGAPGTDDYGCTAYATELATGKIIKGACITWKMVKGEGWSGKNGSKWNTMPDQMFRYRAAAFLVRTTAPQIAMGLLTKEEIEDMPHDPSPPSGGNGKRMTLDALTERLESPAEEAEADEPEPETIQPDANEPPSEFEMYAGEILANVGSQLELEPARAMLEKRAKTAADKKLLAFMLEQRRKEV